MQSETGNYLANLVLYPGERGGGGRGCIRVGMEDGALQSPHGPPLLPLLGTSLSSPFLSPFHPSPPPPLSVHTGRVEFSDYLPEGTQGIVVQPVGKAGVLVAGTDVVRGISRLDQVGYGRGWGWER